MPSVSARYPLRPLVFAWLAPLVAATPAWGTLFHGINAGAPVWNGDILLTQAKANAIAATGTKSLRVNFRIDVQAGRTGWDSTMLSQYDTIINNASNAGLNVLGLWSNESVFANQTQWNDTSGGANNAYVGQFVNNAKLLADRYKDSIKRWEVWNEPSAWTNPNYVNDPQNAGGTYILPQVYANLLAETYKGLTNVNGTNLINDEGIRLTYGGDFAHDIGGSFSTTSPYLGSVLSQNAVWSAFQQATGEDLPFDELGYHFYIRQGMDNPVQGADINAYLNDVRATLDTYNFEGPFRITEFGWRTDGSNTEQFQADSMAVAYDALELRDDVAATYWYQWQDEPAGEWGIVQIDGVTPKLAYGEFVTRNIPEPATASLLLAGAAISSRRRRVVA